ncbi:MAG: hypothetical protein WBP93_13990 [Pyrinomonadaceae bacterium]
MTRLRSLPTIFAVLLLAFFYTNALAASGTDEGKDTDTRMVNAKVVEVNDSHISVIARTGVEHVIAVDRNDTKITRDGKVVSLKDLREGDLVTVELDASKKMKFAKNISLHPAQTEMTARNRR